MGFAGAMAGEESTSISFPTWADALQASGMAPPVRARFKYEIRAFLGFCGTVRAPASIELAKRHLDPAQSFEFIAYPAPEKPAAIGLTFGPPTVAGDR